MNAHEIDSEGWPCPTREEMRRVDRHAIEEVGFASRLLMENAGRAVAHATLGRFPRIRRPLVVCGVGNNGGDGFVVARVLHEWDSGIRPIVRVFGDRSRLTEDARANLDLLVRSGVEVELGGAKDDLEAVAAHADVVLDAVFGVGLTRPVTGELASVLETLSGLPLPIVSIDVPSGLSADTGEPLGVAVRPNLTITLGLPKLGLAVRPAQGEVLIVDIGLPAESVAAARIHQWVLTPGAVRRRLPARPEAGHKGTFGHVLVVAGSIGKTGAACLAAEGAVRGGAGLVTVAIPADLNSILEEKLTEAMTLPIPTDTSGCLGGSAAERLEQEARARDSLVVGPGLGTAPEMGGLLERLLSALGKPAVVDADGLNAFARRPESLRGSGPRILTPHPGEMARLLGCSTGEVQADRPSAARDLARRAEAVVVLKGARSVVAAPDGRVWINPTGGPGLATGGTGDVLAGLLGALLAAGLRPEDAAAVGVYLHGRSGEGLGAVGGTAGEVAAGLGRAWTELERGEGTDGRGVLSRFP